MKIGMFDSGVGGLTVLKSVYEKYPFNEYIYIGDNKYNPYGEKRKDELFNYASRIIDYFVKQDIKTIIIACNTICSTILDDLKKKYKSITFIGVIDSTINLFINSGKKNVLVIGTTKTIETHIYKNKINLINKDIIVHEKSTPKLVPMIEKDLDTKEIIKEYLEPYKDIDSIILGCTHYKIIEDKIDKNIYIINSSTAIVNELDSILTNNGVSSIKIYTTGNVIEFNKWCKKIMNGDADYIDL